MTTLGQKTYSPLGWLVLGLALGTGLTVGGTRVMEFNSSGKVDTNMEHSVPLDAPFNQFVTATGSVSTHYAGTCIANPGKALGLSGATLNKLEYQVKNNPALTEADVVFATSWLSTAASGTTLIPNMDNVCSASGCVARFGSGGLKWFKDDFIKVLLKGDPSSSY